MATFITSKSVGQDININVSTSTGYWKYNHDGTDSSLFQSGYQSITVTNANGEFTIIPCLSDGTVSGDIISLQLDNNQLTSFDGTGLSNLQTLYLSSNQLTSFDGTDLTNLQSLYLNGNQLTSFDGTGLSSLTELSLVGNQFTSLSGSIFPVSLTGLNLSENQLTSFDGTGLSGLTQLHLSSNQLTSFDGTGLSSLTQLRLQSNLLTSFDGTDLTSLSELMLGNNQLTSFDGTGLTSLTQIQLSDNQLTSLSNLPTSLTELHLNGNQLTSFDGTGLTSLNGLSLNDNLLTSFNDTDLTSLRVLSLVNNLLTSLDVSSVVSLRALLMADSYGLNGNPMTPSSNDSILSQLVNLGPAQGSGKDSTRFFHTSGGRTSAGTSDYDTLIGFGWHLVGLDLAETTTTTTTAAPSGSGKLRLKGVNTPSNTTTTTTAPTTTTTTTASIPSYMFTIPQPAPGIVAFLSKFRASNIVTTTGYWKYERKNGNGTTDTSGINGPNAMNIPHAMNIPLGYGEFTIISCDVNGNPSGTITEMNLNNVMIDSFNGLHPDLSGLTRLTLVNNSITSLDVSSMTNLNTLLVAVPYGGNTEDAMTPQSNTDILLQLNANGVENGTFTTNGGRVTSQASEAAYLSLINKGWTLLGLTAV